MPARRRKKVPTPDETDPIKRFAAIQRETAERERSHEERERRRRADAAAAAQAAAEHAATLVAAKRELTVAIDGVRTARDRRSGVAEADTRWQAARARLMELETGEAPPWGPSDEPANTDPDLAPAGDDTTSSETRTSAETP